MKRIGVIGCGTIGTIIAKAAEKRLIKCDELILFDHRIDRAKALESLSIPTVVVESLEEMIRLRPNVIVEAASQQAVKDYIDRILLEDIDVVVMSVGALLSLDIRADRIHVPSGAIGGLDAVSTAALAGIEEATLTTRKNPIALDMKNLEEEIIFEGTPQEAVNSFPREMNVAATLSLAMKARPLRVRMISDPKVMRNIHEIEIKWKLGELFLRFANDPHPDNAKTSALAAWSAIKTLSDLINT